MKNKPALYINRKMMLFGFVSAFIGSAGFVLFAARMKDGATLFAGPPLLRWCFYNLMAAMVIIGIMAVAMSIRAIGVITVNCEESCRENISHTASGHPELSRAA